MEMAILYRMGASAQAHAAYTAFLAALEASQLRDRMQDLGIYADASVLGVGREKGPCVWFADNVYCQGGRKNRLYLWFCEHRNTDDLIVQVWQGTVEVDTPTHEKIPESAWKPYHATGKEIAGRMKFPWLDCLEAVEAAQVILGRFVRSIEVLKKGLSKA